MAHSMKVVLDLAALQHKQILSLVSDIPDDKICAQFPSVTNHPLWQLGHLTGARALVGQILGQPASIPADWRSIYGPGSKPSPDASKYISKQQMLETFERVHNHAINLIASLSDEKLDSLHGIEPISKVWPTVRHLTTAMFTFHDGYHIGQLHDWRRAANMGPAGK